MTPKKTLALLVSIAIIFSGAGWVVGRHSVADTMAAKPTAAPDAQRKVLYWYDPMNQAIRPKAPIVGFGEYDPLAESQCLVRNMKTRGVQSCNQFVCKI